MIAREPNPIPEPLRLGEASERFAWPWTIVRWGDMGAGDPACDLVAAWMHFDPAFARAGRLTLERLCA